MIVNLINVLMFEGRCSSCYMKFLYILVHVLGTLTKPARLPNHYIIDAAFRPLHG